MKISLLILAFIFCEKSDTTEWKTLENSDYLIQYPDHWNLNESGLSGTKFILFDQPIQGQTFTRNINLIVQDLSGTGLDLKKYTELSIDQIKQSIVSSEIFFSNTEQSRQELVYAGTLGELSLKWKQYFWIKNEKAYILSYTATKDSFDDQLELINQIMDSFKIK